MIAYTLVRSERRTLGIYIMPDARVEVRAPRRCPVSDIESFLESKRGWIERKLKEAAFRQENRTGHPFGEGSTLPYQGEELPVCPNENGRLMFDGRAFSVPSWMLEEGSAADRREALIGLYKRLASPLISERVELFVKAFNLKPMEVKVSRAAKRWGSCSGRGSLNFSWMLAAAHPAALDYVVVHELCHLIQHNHSARFWELVASVLPDYQERQKLLRLTERRLSVLAPL